MMDTMISYTGMMVLLVSILVLTGAMCALWLVVVERLLSGVWKERLVNRPLITLSCVSGRLPLLLIIMIIGVNLMALVAETHANTSFDRYLPLINLYHAVAGDHTFFGQNVHYLCKHLVPKLVRADMPYWQVRNISRMISHVLQGVVVVIAILVALPLLGVDITGILALGESAVWSWGLPAKMCWLICLIV